MGRNNCTMPTKPREEVSVEERTEGDKTIKTTTTKIYHNDGKIETQVRTQTTTRTRVRVEITEHEQIQIYKNDLREAIGQARSGGSTSDLQHAIDKAKRSNPKVPHTDIRHAEDILQELERERKRVVRTETKTTHGDGWTETSVTTHYSDGSSSTEMSRESESRTQPRARADMQEGMDSDINRLRAEANLRKSIQGDLDFNYIQECIHSLEKEDQTESSFELIQDAYDTLIMIRPQDGGSLTNLKYKDLPFMGMKRFLRDKHGLSQKEVDPPLSKYELDKVAKKHGIRFPDVTQLNVLSRQRTLQRKY